MTPVAVVGMHRSGTSMIAALLYRAGVYLGAQKDLMPPDPDNEDGYWANVRFVKLNEDLLRASGGGWDEPPQEFDAGKAEVRAIRPRAAAIRLEFDRRSPWAWKDPRTTVTLPFWLDVFPDLRIVGCIRNPLEVALSLHRRDRFSYEHGLALWLDYNRRLLRQAPRDRLVLTHYDAYFADPAAELGRVLARCGVEPTVSRVKRACAAVRPGLHHNRFGWSDLLAADVPQDVIELYAQLCDESGWGHHDRVALTSNGSRRRQRRPLNRVVIDTMLRRQLNHAAHQARQESATRDLQRDLDETRSQLRDREEQALQRSHEQAELKAELRELRERVEEFETLDSDKARAAISRRRAAAPFREAVMGVVPAGAHVLVLSNGDDMLLDLRSRKAQHFPQSRDGGSTGAPPASDLVAIAQLEALRYRFSEPTYLAIPKPHLWWLDRYNQVARHLERHNSAVYRSNDAVVYRLGSSWSDSNWQARLEDLLGAFSARFGRDATVLDWKSGLEVAVRFPEFAVFSPPDSSRAELPYLDGTVDIVAVSAGDGPALAEARRVAAAAIAQVSAGSLEVEWVVSGRTILPSVSIVIPSYNGIAFTEACLRSLIETVPPWLDAEFVVVDDGSSDSTQERLAVLSSREPRLRVLRNEVNVGFLVACNRGAFESRGEVVLWLNNDTLALPGWLTPILRIFQQRADVAGVGGKLVYPDGRLQEAGGLVFSDGRAANYGKWNEDPSDPLFDYVREVDYVSGAHLAFRRSFLDQVGGFDERYRPMYCEDSDICFKARELGLKILYQPESAIIHVEGGTAGTDEAQGHKQYQAINRETFITRWQEALRDQPTYPNRFDLSTLHRLAARGRG